ncbi:unnamed protein product [Soboliphyme baturini]|uniref:Histone domain-containing protein n=1 Tax=Soboliphyme baturini TaxID=241478 RepID=A0A183J274_9BILA|nr:unnamed protein product [Soboliphyme baturini]
MMDSDEEDVKKKPFPSLFLFLLKPCSMQLQANGMADKMYIYFTSLIYKGTSHRSNIRNKAADAIKPHLNRFVQC